MRNWQPSRLYKEALHFVTHWNTNRLSCYSITLAHFYSSFVARVNTVDSPITLRYWIKPKKLLSTNFSELKCPIIVKWRVSSLLSTIKTTCGYNCSVSSTSFEVRNYVNKQNKFLNGNINSLLIVMATTCNNCFVILPGCEVVIELIVPVEEDIAELEDVVEVAGVPGLAEVVGVATAAVVL